MNDLLVISRFKNLRMWRLMRGRTNMECAKLCGVSDSIYGALLNLKRSPFYAQHGRGTFTEDAQRIASGLGMEPDDLFPRSLYALTLPDKVEREYDSVDLPMQLSVAKPLSGLLDNPEHSAQLGEMRKALRVAMADMKPNWRFVLERRFGLDGEPPMTLMEIAAGMRVSPERVRQVEREALEHLRHLKHRRLRASTLNTEQFNKLYNLDTQFESVPSNESGGWGFNVYDESMSADEWMHRRMADLARREIGTTAREVVTQ